MEGTALLDAEHNIKEEFYTTLDSIIQKTPATDKLILMGDFNARVGTEHLVWKNVIGQHGVGKMNSNGPGPPGGPRRYCKWDVQSSAKQSDFCENSDITKVLQHDNGLG